MEIAGAVVAIVEADGILGGPTHIRSKPNIVMTYGVAPIVIHLIGVLSFEERSGSHTELRKIWNIERRQASIECEVACIHSRDA